MRRQRGVTMIGWIFLLAPMAVVLYAGLRVGPEYLNYYKVLTAMKETASKLKSDGSLTAQSIRSALGRRAIERTPVARRRHHLAAFEHQLPIG